MRAASLALALVALGGCSNDELLAEPGEAGPPSDAALVEPKGTPWFTWVHGVVDAPRIAFCFVQLLNGELTEPSGVLTPRKGLAWGEAVTTPDPGGFDWGGDDILPFVIAGDVSLIEDAGCRAAKKLAESGDGGTEPPIRMLPLTVIPAGTLEGGRGHLLVATGCVHDPACGSPATLSAVLVALSRIVLPGRVGLQAVNASQGSGALDFASKPASEAETAFVAGVAYGSIAPFPPFLDRPQSAYPLSAVLEARGAAGTIASTWSAALARGGLTALADGRTYAALAIGPDPALTAQSSWNASTLTVVPTEPGE